MARDMNNQFIQNYQRDINMRGLLASLIIKRPIKTMRPFFYLSDSKNPKF